MVTACIGLGFMVLIQNPKGGGLNANVGGLSNNFMGVKQTTDVLEKGTWILSSILVILCLVSALVINSDKGTGAENIIKNIPTTTGTAPVQQAPAPVNPTADTSK